jgi:hypothetical protein
MGSVQKMKKEIFRRKVVMVSIFLFPFLVTGMGLIGYQTYHIFTGKGFQALNFTISDLWRSINPSEGLDVYARGEQSIFATLPIADLLKPNQSTVALSSMPKVLALSAATLKDGAFLNEKNKDDFNLISRPNIIIDRTPFLDDFFSRPIIFQKYLSQISKEHFLPSFSTKEKNKWYIGLSYHHLRSYRNLNYRPISMDGITYEGNRRYVFGQTEGFRNSTDRQAIFSGFALNVGYQVKPKWRVESGLSVKKMGEKVEVVTNGDNTNSDVAGFQGMTVCLSPEVEQVLGDMYFKNTYSFVDIPVTIYYSVKQTNQFDFTIFAGISPRWMYATTAMIYNFSADHYFLANDASNAVMNQFNVSVSSGFSFTHPISSLSEVHISPYFERNVLSTFSDEYVVNQKNYAAGLNIGIRKFISTKKNIGTFDF